MKLSHSDIKSVRYFKLIYMNTTYLNLECVIHCENSHLDIKFVLFDNSSRLMYNILRNVVI